MFYNENCGNVSNDEALLSIFSDLFSSKAIYEYQFKDTDVDGEKVKNVVKFFNGQVMVKAGKNGNTSINTNVMPDISDISIYGDKDKTKVVIVTFADDTIEKSVLSKDDVYSLEQGISICITKKLLSDKTFGNGSSVYNKILKHGMKVVEQKQKAINEKLISEKRETDKIAKLERKRAARRAKQEAAERERFIEIQKEAYLRAMSELNKNEKRDS